MRRRRSLLDIINQSLHAANDDGGATKTKIVYSAYLRDPQLNKYLSILTESELLRSRLDNNNNNFNKLKTTKKGLEFLNTYNQMYTIVKRSATKLMPEEKLAQEHPPIATR